MITSRSAMQLLSHLFTRRVPLRFFWPDGGLWRCVAVLALCAAFASTVVRADEPFGTTMELDSSDMVYDATRDILWLSVQPSDPLYADRVVGVNPSTMEAEQVIEVGSDPIAIAISDDHRFLYVALRGDRGYRQIDLEDLSVGPVIAVGEALYPRDIQVMPGQPRTVAVPLHSTGSTAQSGVAIFDDGVSRGERSDRLQRNGQILFGSDPDRLFGFDGSRFHRYEIDSEGIRHVDQFSDLFSSGHASFINGWIVGFGGEIVDPYDMEIIAFLKTPGPVAVDPESGRLFQASRGDGSWLDVYETDTFTRIERLPRPTHWGLPVQLVRWGSMGLALRTNQNRLVVLESEAIPAGRAEARLETEIRFGSLDAWVDQEISYRVVATNRGPDEAESVLLNHTVPEGLRLIEATGDGDPLAASDGAIQFERNLLAVGETAEIAIRAVPEKTGRLELSATAVSDTRNPKPSAAEADAAIWGSGQEMRHRIVAERLSHVTDFASDPVREVFYASIGSEHPRFGNHLVALDVSSGEVTGTIYAGPQPVRLRLSDDYSALYVVTRNNHWIARIDLDQWEVDLQFGPGLDYFGPLYTFDLEVLPGGGESVAIARRQSGSSHSVAVFDDGVPRGEVARAFSAEALIPTHTPDEIFGVRSRDLRSYSIDESGVWLRENLGGFLPTHLGLRQAINVNGTVYLSGGEVVSLAGPTLIGTYGTPENFRNGIVLDQERRRTVFLRGAGDLLAYNTDTFDQTSRLPIPWFSQPTGPLLQVDETRLAFLGEGSIVFMDTSVTSTGRSNLAVAIENPPADMRVGMTWTYTIKLANEGGEPVTQLTISQPSAGTWLDIDAVDTSMGTSQVVNRSFEVYIESLGAGETAEIAVTIRPRTVRSFTTPVLEITSVEVDENPSLRHWELPFESRSEGTLFVELPGEASEGDGILAGAGTVRLGEAEAFDVVVTLVSSDYSKLLDPGEVTVPAGATSVSFDLEVVDNDILDGSQTVSVSASAAGFETGSASMVIHDNEEGGLELLLPDSLAHEVIATGEVRIAAPAANSITVTLSTEGPGWLTLPETVVIAGGNNSAVFEFSASSLIPPAEGVWAPVTASVSGWSAVDASLLVLPPPPDRPFNPSPGRASEFVGTSPLLVWNEVGSQELLVNGGFSTGDFHGWDWELTGEGGWVVDDGTFDPPGPLEPQPPMSNPYSALSYHDGEGTATLYQDVYLPHGANEIRLFWSHKIFNYASDYYPGSQEFQARLYSSNGDLLETLFTTQPGSFGSGNLDFRLADLTQYAGRQVRLAFSQTHNEGFLNVFIDFASITAFYSNENVVDGDVFDVYLGTSPYLTPEDFYATVEEPELPVAGLEKGVTYYWQVVMRRGEQTSFSPVWSFSTAAIGVEIVPPEGPTSDDPLDFEISFSAPVNPPQVDQFTIENSLGASISGEGANYLLSVIPAEYGEVTVHLPANRVRNADGDGTAASTIASVFFIAPVSFDRWREGYFTAAERNNDPEGTGLHGDAGEKGVPNYLRYAVGMRDGEVDRSLLPRLDIAESGEGRFLDLIFHRLHEAVDAEYLIETSTDLKTWTPAEEFLEGVVVEDAGYTERVVARIRDPLVDDQRLFLRLRVEKRENQ